MITMSVLAFLFPKHQTTMKIKQYDVPQRAIEACESRMRSGQFKAVDITKAAMLEGVPEIINREYVANRVADRLIQKHRKAGNIRMVDRKPTWEFCMANVQALAPLGRRCASRRDSGLKLRKAWPTEQPQRLTSRALFALGSWDWFIA
jgi:hypothetical protein